MLEAVVALAKPVVLVLVNGRPLNIVWASGRVPAILEVWHPGTEAGNAVADIIAKSEARYGDTLLDLRARFGLMARPWAHKEALPVGPAIVAWAFADAVKHAAVRREIFISSAK